MRYHCAIVNKNVLHSPISRCHCTHCDLTRRVANYRSHQYRYIDEVLSGEIHQWHLRNHLVYHVFLVLLHFASLSVSRHSTRAAGLTALQIYFLDDGSGRCLYFYFQFAFRQIRPETNPTFFPALQTPPSFVDVRKIYIMLSTSSSLVYDLKLCKTQAKRC